MPRGKQYLPLYRLSLNLVACHQKVYRFARLFGKVVRFQHRGPTDEHHSLNESSALNEPVVDISVVSAIVDVDGSSVVVTKSKARKLIKVQEKNNVFGYLINLPAFRVVTVVDSF